MASPENKIRFGGWNHTDWGAARARINRLAFSERSEVEKHVRRKRGNKKCAGTGHDLVLVPPTGKPDYMRDSKVQHWANLFNNPIIGLSRADVYVCSRCGKVKIKGTKK